MCTGGERSNSKCCEFVVLFHAVPTGGLTTVSWRQSTRSAEVQTSRIWPTAHEIRDQELVRIRGLAMAKEIAAREVWTCTFSYKDFFLTSLPGTGGGNASQSRDRRGGAKKEVAKSERSIRRAVVTFKS